MWKDIVNCPGYQVSNEGLIRTVDRYGWAANRKPPRLSGKTINPTLRKDGYYQFNVRKEGKTLIKYVHHVVAEAFLGIKPEGHEVCHRDGNPSNNLASNLRYDTPTGNQADKKLHGTYRAVDNHPASLMTNAEVLKMRKLYKEGYSVKEIHSMFPYKWQTVYFATTGRSWKTLEESKAYAQ